MNKVEGLRKIKSEKLEQARLIREEFEKTERSREEKRKANQAITKRLDKEKLKTLKRQIIIQQSDEDITGRSNQVAASDRRRPKRNTTRRDRDRFNTSSN